MDRHEFAWVAGIVALLTLWLIITRDTTTAGHPAVMLDGARVSAVIFGRYGSPDVVCPTRSVVAGDRFPCLGSGGIRYVVRVLDSTGRFQVSRVP